MFHWSIICNVINYWCLHAGSPIFGKYKLSVAQLIALQGFVTICTNHWSCWTNKVSEESSCCFELFFTVAVIDNLVQQTRIYADQQGVVEFELYRELLLSLLWTVQGDGSSTIMRRDRFFEIMQYILWIPQEPKSDQAYDPLYKLRPLISHLIIHLLWSSCRWNDGTCCRI